MYTITRKEDLNSADYLIDVIAPDVAKRFKPGNFAVLITVPNGERIPMSIERAEGDIITMYIKRLGKTSRELDSRKVGDSLHKVIGPMGTPPPQKKYGTVIFASDLVCGHAENNAMCRELSKIPGNHIISIQSFPDKSQIYPDKELAKHWADEYILATEDGSVGRKGHYLDIIKELLEERKIDQVFAGGGIPPLQKTLRTYQKVQRTGLYDCSTDYGRRNEECAAPAVYSSMCEQKLACIDGPMFDGHKVDWEAAISRLAMFKNKEVEAMECYNHKMMEEM